MLAVWCSKQGNSFSFFLCNSVFFYSILKRGGGVIGFRLGLELNLIRGRVSISFIFTTITTFSSS